VLGDLAVNERHVHFREDAAGVGDGAEIAELGAEAAFRLAVDEALGVEPVADEVCDRDHFQGVALAELFQLRDAGHGAVIVHDFADDAAGAQSSQAGQVDHGLGLSGAHQDAAFARTQRKYVTGAGEILRAGAGIDGDADGAGAVGGRDTGGDAFRGFNRLAKGGAKTRGVARRHHGQVQGVADLGAEGKADQAAGVLGHRVDDIGRDHFGRDGEIAFVLAVLVVDDDEHSSSLEVLNRFGNAGEWHVNTRIQKSRARS